MTSRAIALVAGTALATLVASAVRLAVADPLAGTEKLGTAGTPRSGPPEATAAERPPAASAPAGQWTARKQTGVSAGVLVRAASRRPLDRGAACSTGEDVREGEETAGRGRCPPVAARGEPIEIDWHGDRAAP